MTTDAIRDEIRAVARGRAYLTFDDAVADFPMAHINTRAPNVSYRPWQLLEHMRSAQRDILGYIRDPRYRLPKWPDRLLAGGGRRRRRADVARDDRRVHP